MATFTIDSENKITGYAPGEAVPEGNAERFTTEGELAELAAHWPAARLVEVWNSIAGSKPVKKFTDRNTAVARVWKAVYKAKRLAHRRRTWRQSRPGRGNRATRKPKAHTARNSKKSSVIRLLERAKGATLAEIMSETGWQAHSVRGFISGTLGKKLKLKIESFRTEKGDRAYRVRG
jgi:hypothetical protein